MTDTNPADFDEQRQSNVREFSSLSDKARRPAPPLQSGNGGGTYDGMNERVSQLETHFGYVRKDLDEIKGSLKALASATEKLATKDDIERWRWQWIATGVGIVALVVGGIIGGLAWIKPDGSQTAQQQQVQSPPAIIIQIPAIQQAPAPAGR